MLGPSNPFWGVAMTIHLSTLQHLRCVVQMIAAISQASRDSDFAADQQMVPGEAGN